MVTRQRRGTTTTGRKGKQLPDPSRIQSVNSSDSERSPLNERSNSNESDGKSTRRGGLIRFFRGTRRIAGIAGERGRTRKEEIDFLDRVGLQATLASGQPTCTGPRPCRRQENEENGHEKRVRRANAGCGSLCGKLRRISVGRFLGNEEDEAGNGKRHRLRWCRRDLRWIADVATRTLLLGIVLFVTPGEWRPAFFLGSEENRFLSAFLARRTNISGDGFL